MNAVEVRNIQKSYGEVAVLRNLNMTVREGTIYGLLGASGCGKTTLLSCMIGMLPAESGRIRVLGERVVDNVIPSVSNRIGYLPQETSLIGELSVKETLYFFGNIYQYDKDKMSQRYEMLHTLFELPADDRRVENCSGGQKRRVSLASVLMHEPQLLFLDEPTVGLDPILRDKTWKFLVEISRSSLTTVIITTHYIEEARQSDRCGLMRNGVLLDEDSPQNIIFKHGCETLEEAFLKLCVRQGSEDFEEKIVKQESIEYNPVECSEEFQVQNTSRQYKERKYITRQSLTAMMKKNITMIWRQPMGFLNLLFSNLINIIVFYYAIGSDPAGLNIAIVNDESPYRNFCQNSSLITTFAHNYTCDLHMISCRFIDSLSDHYYNKLYYRSFDRAYEDALHGKLYAIFHFERNFTESTQAVWRGEVEDEFSPVVDFAEIKVHVDKTDFQLRVFFEKQIRATYDKYAQEMLKDCGYAIRLDSSPVHFEKPIYGSLDADFKLMMGPIIVMLMMYFMSMSANITIITDDRTNGLWNRTLLAGRGARFEYLASHTIIMSLFNLIQLVQTLFFFKWVLNTTDITSLAMIAVFLFVLSFSGMFSAFIMGCLVDSQESSFYCLNGLGVLTMTLSGIIWPVEAMPTIVQFFVYFSPVYIPARSARDIVIKGYGIYDFTVYIGFIYSFCWMFIAAIITHIILQRKGFRKNS